MRKNRLRIAAILVFLLCTLLLTACVAASGAEEDMEGAQEALQQEQTPTLESEELQQEQGEVTLEELLGEDYVDYLTETIIMQMGNRMIKTPEVRYFPIEDDAPLSDYVTIDETTKFEIDDEGNPVIYFPAGTVTDEANGEQSFRIPKLYQ